MERVKNTLIKLAREALWPLKSKRRTKSAHWVSWREWRITANLKTVSAGDKQEAALWQPIIPTASAARSVLTGPPLPERALLLRRSLLPELCYTSLITIENTHDY
jgi:hypothetical protein